jgi:hypothetical protein
MIPSGPLLGLDQFQEGEGKGKKITGSTEIS